MESILLKKKEFRRKFQRLIVVIVVMVFDDGKCVRWLNMNGLSMNCRRIKCNALGTSNSIKIVEVWIDFSEEVRIVK